MYFKGYLKCLRKMIKGVVKKIESKDYYVLISSEEVIRCSLPGKIKNKYKKEKGKQYRIDIVAVGDFVYFNLNDDGTGVIVKIEERKNQLSRKALRIKGGSFRGARLEQVIAANIDNIFIVSSISSPQFNNRVVDRILVAAESSKIKCNIIINKIDLDVENFSEYWTELYAGIGYNVFCTSVPENKGFNKLIDYLKNNVNLFWGASGVGKSSILNLLFPHLSLKTAEVSKYSSKGQHTTVTSLLEMIDKKTFVIDTPGIREIDPFGIQGIDLAHYFVEFIPYLESCRFNTCTHFHEPGCAVIKAVEENKISMERFESYVNLLNTIEDGMNF